MDKRCKRSKNNNGRNYSESFLFEEKNFHGNNDKLMHDDARPSGEFAYNAAHRRK